MDKFNGYTNKATWLFILWLENDRYLYDLATEKSNELETNDLALWLQSYLSDNNPLDNGLFSDLLTFAMDCINFIEVAQAIKEL